ncbi:MAG TPA: nucleotidyltransferase domain-containing protein [Puia sp.]|nr:nucleotidyltransferase domain-containing protein [Puia sp.]
MHTKSAIISALGYFDLFNYPLTQREIWLFLQHPAPYRQFGEALSGLVQRAVVNKFGEFYSLRHEPGDFASRSEGNKKAVILLRKARKVAKLVSLFPFVRGVGVSGSLSKNFANDSSDIDLFIITAPNRLWLARTILHGFKKLTFIFNRQHLYCMNYFVDQQQLEIEEKNIYTATEVATLIPMQGETAFKEFFAANAWTKSFLPHHFLRVSSAANRKVQPVPWLVEKALGGRQGNRLDDYLMEMTNRRWREKTLNNQKNSRGVTMSMIARKHLAKPDPAFFQEGLLKQYAEKIEQLAKQFEADYAIVK